MEKIQAEAPITPRGMSEEDAARYIGVARISLRQGRCEGRRENRMPPPPYIKLGRKVIYTTYKGVTGMAGHYRKYFCNKKILFFITKYGSLTTCKVLTIKY